MRVGRSASAASFSDDGRASGTPTRPTSAGEGLCSRELGGTGRPATFRDVFASREFRAIYAASTLSWIGDYVARAAVTALVYQVTDSVAASAAAFAISYAPWLLGGSVLVVARRAVPVPHGHGHLRRRPDAHHGGGRDAPACRCRWCWSCSCWLRVLHAAVRRGPLGHPARGARRRPVRARARPATRPPPSRPRSSGTSSAPRCPITNPRLALADQRGHASPSPRCWSGSGCSWRRAGAGPRTAAPTCCARPSTASGSSSAPRRCGRSSLLVFCGVLFVVVPEGLGAAWAATLADGAGTRAGPRA